MSRGSIFVGRDGQPLAFYMPPHTTRPDFYDLIRMYGGQPVHSPAEDTICLIPDGMVPKKVTHRACVPCPSDTEHLAFSCLLFSHRPKASALSMLLIAFKPSSF